MTPGWFKELAIASLPGKLILWSDPIRSGVFKAPPVLAAEDVVALPVVELDDLVELLEVAALVVVRLLEGGTVVVVVVGASSPWPPPQAAARATAATRRPVRAWNRVTEDLSSAAGQVLYGIHPAEPAIGRRCSKDRPSARRLVR